jgi:hypothetical protein
MTKRILLFILCIVMFNPISINKVCADIKGVKPSEACDLFIGSGLSTGGWHIYYDYVCGCSSEHDDLFSKKASKDNLSYFVEGTCKNIRRLKLSVEIKNANNAEKLIAELKNAARVLIEKITEKPAPTEILSAISEKKNLSMTIDETMVTVNRTDWTTTTDTGTVNNYQITVSLE